MFHAVGGGFVLFAILGLGVVGIDAIASEVDPETMIVALLILAVGVFFHLIGRRCLCAARSTDVESEKYNTATSESFESQIGQSSDPLEFGATSPENGRLPIQTRVALGGGLTVTGADSVGPVPELERVWSIVRAVTKQHLTTLKTQKRLKIVLDAYGREIGDKWRAEVEYFVENIVFEALENQCSRQEITAVLDRTFVLSGRQMEGTRSLDFTSMVMCYVMSEVTVADSDLDFDADLSPHEYEAFCAAELEVGGWRVHRTPGSGDQGVDVVAVKDGMTAVFQCKLYSKPVGNKAVQEVHTGSAFYRASLAAVVSNAGYTPSARAAAAQTGTFLLHHSELATFSPPQA